MKKKDIKIAGVVTLYHPTLKDIDNINTYIDDIERLYVIDNTEDENNYDKLPKNKKIKYIFNGDNIGVAAALNLGAKYAIDEGYKYLLTMDQDTTFKSGVIDILKKGIIDFDMMKKVGILTPWHNTKLNLEKIKDEYDYPPEVMTSGNILNLDIFKEVGGFKEWMFIDGIDIEYCLNVRSHGYKIVRATKAEIDHNLGDIKWRTFFKKRYPCGNHPAVRRYYIMRNCHYICDMYKEFDPNVCWRIISQKDTFVEILLFEKGKYKKIRNLIRGYKDYKKGIKGKYPYKN